MSEYTTGEMAKLCNITVRTVQYYDTRNILVPSRLSDGGRRLYSQEDLQKLKVICFLRQLGLSINSIGEILEEESPENVISLLLSQQINSLEEEISEKQLQLNSIKELTKELNEINDFSVKSISDVAYIMKNKKQLRKVRGIVLAVGILMDIVEVATFVIGITKGIWYPFIIGMIAVIIAGVLISAYYFNSVKYICPHCHTVFKPKFKEAFFAFHTPKARKLKCPNCGHKGYCVEVYGGKEENENN